MLGRVIDCWVEPLYDMKEVGESEEEKKIFTNVLVGHTRHKLITVFRAQTFLAVQRVFLRVLVQISVAHNLIFVSIPVRPSVP